jgi:hypothetical protein
LLQARSEGGRDRGADDAADGVQAATAAATGRGAGEVDARTTPSFGRVGMNPDGRLGHVDLLDVGDWQS